MNGSRLIIASLSCGLLVAGCASTPQHSEDVVAAKAAVTQARTDQRVLDFAPVQLQTAEGNLKKAESLLDDRKSDVLMSHYAYLATREAQTAIAMGETGAVKKQIVPPDLLEEVFDLNMQLEELRMNKKMGEHDPALAQDLEAHKAQFEKKYEELASELKTHWNRWDATLDRHNDAERRGALDSMVDLLNRRSYIRNLVRDVNEALEN